MSVLEIVLKKRIIFLISKWIHGVNFILLAGKGKEEEEGRERRDKNRKNVTGDGTIQQIRDT